jgi:polyisoprenoid-binding protein YceI
MKATQQHRAPLLLAAALLAAAACIPAPPLAAQQERAELLPESRVRVDGTSNRDDWSVHAAELRGHVVLEPAGAGVRLRQGGFTVPARRLVSDDVIMDRLMWGALKAGAHPEIVYEFAGDATVPAGVGPHAVATRGTVTIAGVTRQVVQDVRAERLADGRLRFTGSHPLLMSDFGMTPPTAMFGALRTGNRVVVHFDLVVRTRGAP